ncbi:uncharacterized protein [Pyxicephalus adspersus]|uniref:uncharacterized protein n=1 Tax=Pyxicephalus adspersus TaxID=30357 RepID=UPI003B5B3F6E
MHVTFNDVTVYLTEEEWRNLNRGQMQLYMEVMNENYASLQSLGLPVPEADLLKPTEPQKRDMRPYYKLGESSYPPQKTGKTSNVLGEMVSLTPGSMKIQVNGCEPSQPSQNVPESQQNCLASFKKEMLQDSSLKPKCETCKGILRCYCDILKEKRKKPYVCEDCGKAYHIEMYLLLHQKSHFREHLHKCSFCEKSFDKLRVLQKHMKTHPEQTKKPPGSWQKASRSPAQTQQVPLHSCEQCQVTFPRKNLLRIHIQEHKKVNSCLICGQIFQTSAELKIHLKGHKKPYECTVCGMVCSNKPDFMLHLREHTGEQIYKCKICMKSYSRLPIFIKHMNVHISQDVHGSQLIIPGEDMLEQRGTIQTVFHGFSQRVEELDGKARNSMLEVNTDTAKDKEHFTVQNECSSEFKPFKKGKLKTCKKCKKSFRYQESFRRHRKSHQVRFTCNQCGKIFQKLIRLYLHRRCHQNYRPYMCKVCSKTFSFKSLLLLHRNTHDSSESRSQYPCAYCSKVFRSQANCILHHNSHIIKPDPGSPTSRDLENFSNIQIAPFSEPSAEKRPIPEMPASKDYVKRLCYRPCVQMNTSYQRPLVEFKKEKVNC